MPSLMISIVIYCQYFQTKNIMQTSNSSFTRNRSEARVQTIYWKFSCWNLGTFKFRSVPNMLPRKVFSVKPGLCSKLKTETRSPSPPGSIQRHDIMLLTFEQHLISRSPEIFHEQYCDNTRKGNRSSMEDLSIPEPVKASRLEYHTNWYEIFQNVKQRFVV